MSEAVNLQKKLATFSELWSPRIVATLNDYDVMVVRVKDEFVWHSHPDTDDFFLVTAVNSTLNSGDARSHSGLAKCLLFPEERNIARWRVMERPRFYSSSRKEHQTPGTRKRQHAS